MSIKYFKTHQLDIKINTKKYIQHDSIIIVVVIKLRQTKQMSKVNTEIFKYKEKLNVIRFLLTPGSMMLTGQKKR